MVMKAVQVVTRLFLQKQKATYPVQRLSHQTLVLTRRLWTITGMEVRPVPI